MSDLQSQHLSDLEKLGLVDRVLDIDVEDIPFEDEYFDFVFIKESFHHFPRPWLGFYECARVAKHGVLMIEPSDINYNLVLTYPEASDYRDAYEAVGNYKYQVNIREALKVNWAMGWGQLVAKGFNDPFPAGGLVELKPYLAEKKRLDKMGQNAQRPDNLLLLAFLRNPLQRSQKLSRKGFRIYDKPHNQFAK